MPTFDCLYLLQNPELLLLEIKRTDLSEQAEVSERFKWLRIEKTSMAITALQFSAMDAAGSIEERYFLEGYLKFDENTGTFIEKFNSAQHALVRESAVELSNKTVQAISKFLAQELSKMQA